MHEELLLLTNAAMLAVGMRAMVRWCEGTDQRAQLEPPGDVPAVARDVHMWDADAADAPEQDAVTHAALTRAVAARHARGIQAAAHTPLPCPLCQAGDLRRSCIAVHVFDDVTQQLRRELWCPACAPLVRGGWLRPAPKETW